LNLKKDKAGMETPGWIILGFGIIIILGAWTNSLNYYGDERDGDDHAADYASWALFCWVFRKNRKAFRIFLFSTGVFFTVNAINFCPAAKNFLKATARLLLA
jgi:hypothetical protein